MLLARPSIKKISKPLLTHLLLLTRKIIQVKCTKSCSTQKAIVLVKITQHFVQRSNHWLLSWPFGSIEKVIHTFFTIVYKGNNYTSTNVKSILQPSKELFLSHSFYETMVAAKPFKMLEYVVKRGKFKMRMTELCWTT